MKSATGGHQKFTLLILRFKLSMTDYSKIEIVQNIIMEILSMMGFANAKTQLIGQSRLAFCTRSQAQNTKVDFRHKREKKEHPLCELLARYRPRL